MSDPENTTAPGESGPAGEAALPSLEEGEVLGFLKSFAQPDSHGAGYLEDHLKRFVETIRRVPPGAPGRRLLELGAAYHHITPALARFCGYDDITCTDLWEGDPRVRRTLETLDGSFRLEVEVDNFDIEKDPYPYPDASFDAVICCEILEHLSHDPMHMMREINRILRPGGHVLLTTPNLASAKSLAYVLKGQSPYIWGQYPVGGRVTDRHNREYTALEVRKLLELAGFRAERLDTVVSWWPVDPRIFEILERLGFPSDLRGDNTLALGRRCGPPQARYPAELYHGGEVGRELGAEINSVIGVEAAPTHSREPGRAERRDHGPLRILVVNNILPNHDRGGSCFRMMTLLKLLRESGHEIDYLGRDAKGMEKYARDLEAIGVRAHGTDPEKLRVWDDVPGEGLDVERILREGDFDIAILLLWFWSSPTIPEQYLHEIRRHSPKTRILVLSDDVHWLHDARMADVTGKRSDLERGLGYRSRETEIFRKADLVSAITEDDAACIREEDPSLTVEIIPHFIPPREGPSPGFEPRRDVIAVGAFGYHANVDAVRWFAREAWPLVREQLPGVRFRIVGGSPPPAVRELACEDIEVTGWVKDIVAELDRCRVFVSAIRYGTGLKTKNIQAMGAGVPVVGTTISLSGSGAETGVHAMIEDDPRRIVEAVVRLYTDEDAWTRMTTTARRFAASRFGKEAVQAAIERTIALAGGLPASGRGAEGEWSISAVEKRDPAIVGAPRATERFRARLAAHLKLCGEHLDQARPEAAIEELRRLLAHCGTGAFKENPGFFSGVMCRFGDAYRELGKVEEAVACFHEALELDPHEEDALRAVREMAPESVDRSLPRPEPISIEGRRGFSYLCPALEGDSWKDPLGAYLERFAPGDDVSLLLLGPAERLEGEVLGWLRERGLDAEGIADVLIVPPPPDPADLPRFLAAADALLLPAAVAEHVLATEASRLGVPILRAGRDIPLFP